MLEIFPEEAQEIVEETTRMLEEWMADPEVLEPVRILQRGLHTLKGGARMAGVTALGDIAHEMEKISTKRPVWGVSRLPRRACPCCSATVLLLL